MNTVVSNDGTTIAFDRTGDGPALILVDGALCYRAFGPSGPLAALLAPHFTVFTYDRRGRGDSADTAPYAVEREVEDIEALVRADRWIGVRVRYLLRRGPCPRDGRSPGIHREAGFV